jgi:hypothetical protein
MLVGHGEFILSIWRSQPARISSTERLFLEPWPGWKAQEASSFGENGRQLITPADPSSLQAFSVSDVNLCPP